MFVVLSFVYPFQDTQKDERGNDVSGVDFLMRMRGGGHEEITK